MIRYLLVWIFTLSIGGYAMAQPAQATTEISAPFSQNDPYEAFNRKMFAFNLALHHSVGKPIVTAYDALPSPMRTGIRNFVTHLGTPLTVVHDLLQGKGEKAVTDFMRFVINTVFGLGGTLDIATEAGMRYQPEDLGQTLYAWGLWDEASFLMLPVLGPYTTREAVGGAVDAWADPVYTAILNANGNVKLALRTLDGIDRYAQVQPFLDQLNEQPDPYIFVRESYLQHRMGLLYDGQPPQPDIDDIDLE